MIRGACICVLALIGAGVVVAQSEIPPQEEHHPPVQDVTPLPEEEGPKRPEPDPDDVESIDSIIDAYYDSISAHRGEPREWDRLRSLFKPMGRMIAARPTQDGAGLWSLEVDDFIDLNDNYFLKSGYFEQELSRRVESFGNIAHAWSTYQSMHGRGIYSIQLLKDGDRWWIVNVYWDFEAPGKEIPEKYLAR